MSKKHYSKDYIKQIVELNSNGKTVTELSSEYGIPYQTINRWCQQYVKNIDTGEEKISIADYKQMKKDYAQLKLEFEILKKATAIFAKDI